MLKDIRKEKNITQEQAASILGITRRTYIKYEQDINFQNTKKGQIYTELLSRYGYIDEEHGILDIETIKKKCNNVFSNYDIKYCYLFGSYAKGEENEKSDIDLLISMPLDGLKFFFFLLVLREELKKKVDLLDARHLGENPELLENILKEGIKIYG